MCGEPHISKLMKRLLEGDSGRCHSGMNIGALASSVCSILRASGGDDSTWWDVVLFVCTVCEGARPDPMHLICNLCILHGDFRIDCKALTTVLIAICGDEKLEGLTHKLWALAASQGTVSEDRITQDWADGCKVRLTLILTLLRCA